MRGSGSIGSAQVKKQLSRDIGSTGMSSPTIAPSAAHQAPQALTNMSAVIVVPSRSRAARTATESASSPITSPVTYRAPRERALRRNPMSAAWGSIQASCSESTARSTPRGETDGNRVASAPGVSSSTSTPMRSWSAKFSSICAAPPASEMKR